MKKSIIYLFFIVLLFLSCTPTNIRESFSYEEDDLKRIWINSYKYEVFYGCIKQGLGNDSLRIILSKKDLFNKSLEIEFNTKDSARNLGYKIIQNMPKPFIKSDENTINKNFISYNCLKYYASKELEELATEEYKRQVLKKSISND
jgi:hypothetical protein